MNPPPSPSVPGVLALDAGNSTVTVGVFRGGKLERMWRIGHARLVELEENLSGEGPWAGGAVASVTPSRDADLRGVVRRITGREAVVVDHHADLGLTLCVDAPETTGADRLANAAAAWQRVRGAVVVADIGTAVTLTAVDGVGRYLGGAIAPGMDVALSGLVARAERLPQIDIAMPRGPIGASTGAAMQAGIVYGYAGLVERLAEEIRTALQAGAGMARGNAPAVLLTGGRAPLLSPLLRVPHEHVPELTLLGLLVAFERAGCERAAGPED
ncbi:MAG: type III pantothenate kinase [Nitrospirota bacterium]|nr:type III pantothenate kinase [Nitrospirota bacterium]